jgi:hypothetical protein
MDRLDSVALKAVTIFSTLTSEQIARVSGAGDVVEYPAGEALTEEGPSAIAFT